MGAEMGTGGGVQWLWEGEHFALGQTDDTGGIWLKQAMGAGSPGEPISCFPLTDDGWAAARSQFAAWEPNSRPVTPVQQPDAPRPTRTSHRHRWLLAATAAVVILAGAIGAAVALAGGSSKSLNVSSGGAGTASAGAGASPVGRGYLAAGGGSVVFIQWTDTKGAIEGTAQEVTTNGQPPQEQTTNGTLSIKGTLQAGNLAVSFDDQPQTFGRLAGGSFTLDVPQPDGTLAPVAFHAASAADFNSAVSALSQQVAAANQQEAATQALQHAQQQVDTDAARVTSDISGLGSDAISLGKAVASVNKALGQVTQDLSTTHAAEQKVLGEASTGDLGTCGDAGGLVGGDAGGLVGGDAGGRVGGDAGGLVEPALSQTRSDLAGLTSDFAQLEADEGKAAGYRPASTPESAAVSQAQVAGNNAISQSVATTNSYIDQANADVVTAFQYTATAYQAGNCGTPPIAPQPQPHIS
jgi:hypothetical protein